MIIDAHGHVHDPVAGHVHKLDAAGADRAVLFATRPHPERAADLASLRREMSALDAALSGRHTADGFRTAARELDAALAAYPGRFIGFAPMPLDAPEPAIAEAVAGAVRRGLRGIGELTPPPGAADRVEPVLRAAADHGGIPVVVHGSAPTTDADLRTLARLAARHPSVPLVVSQLGGPNWMTAIELAREVPSLYLELSTAPLDLAVRLAIRELPGRTMFGSDAPYGDPVVARTAVERATDPGEVRDLVLGGTMARLLGLA
jgi:hypothetical protein